MTQISDLVLTSSPTLNALSSKCRCLLEGDVVWDWSKELLIKAAYRDIAVGAVGFRCVMIHVGAPSVVLDPFIVSCPIGDVALEGPAQDVLDLVE